MADKPEQRWNYLLHSVLSSSDEMMRKVHAAAEDDYFCHAKHSVLFAGPDGQNGEEFLASVVADAYVLAQRVEAWEQDASDILESIEAAGARADGVGVSALRSTNEEGVFNFADLKYFVEQARGSLFYNVCAQLMGIFQNCRCMEYTLWNGTAVNNMIAQYSLRSNTEIVQATVAVHTNYWLLAVCVRNNSPMIA
jgi:hypothetical protein